MKTSRLFLGAALVLACASPFLPAATLHVWQQSPEPTPPYTNWATAARVIQEAVDAASDGDTVLVTNGVYTTGGRAVVGTMTNRVAVDRAIALLSVEGPAVTIIEGAAASGGGNGNGAIRCVYLGANAVLSGFTLQKGRTTAYGSGGGAWADPSAVVSNCVLSGNSAWEGGGGAAGGVLRDCVLRENSARTGGGAYASDLTNCRIAENSAAEPGGGVSDCVLRNCLLTGNRIVDAASRSWGGGAYRSTLYHCTVTRNSARSMNGVWWYFSRGGGVHTCTLFNSIVHGNSAHHSENHDLSSFHHSCTTPLPEEGAGNIAADPQMASASHLSPTSPCIGAADPAYRSGTDLDGDPWANPPSMGADEFVAGHVLGPLQVGLSGAYAQVATGFPVLFTGSIEGQALAHRWDFGDGTVLSNQLRVSHAWSAPGLYEVGLTAYNLSHPAGVSTQVTVRVEAAVYYVKPSNPNPVYPYTDWLSAATNIQEAIDAGTLPGRLVVVTNGHYRQGGRFWRGLTNRVALTNPVVVRSVNGPAVTLVEGAGPIGYGAVRCAWVGNEAVLSGFTLTNGHTWQKPAGNYDCLRGGGVWCEESGLVTNCIMTGNVGWFGAGAAGGTLRDCLLQGNVAHRCGGGVVEGLLYNCVLEDNRTLEYEPIWMEDRLGGGGAQNSVLYNCALTGNAAGRSGGGASGCTLYHCTVAGNTARGAGGGVEWSSLYNSIVYFNSAPSAPNHSGSSFRYSCTTPLPAEGAGNLDADPQMASSTHLSASSSCLARGHPAYSQGTDLDGEAWLAAPAMGADQHVAGATHLPLTLRAQFGYRKVAAGRPFPWVAHNTGPITRSVWNLDPGVFLTNRPFLSHALVSPGSYRTFLTGYSERHPQGVTVTTWVQVVASSFTVQPGQAIQEVVAACDVAGATIWVPEGDHTLGTAVVDGVLTNRVALTNPVVLRSLSGPLHTRIGGDFMALLRGVYVGNHAVLDGFTVVGGRADWNGGGGVWAQGLGLVTNCVIANNFSQGPGGGANGGTLWDCTIGWNYVNGDDHLDSGGGAAWARLVNCLVTGNEAGSGGGTYHSFLLNCTVTGNRGGYGGGMFFGAALNSVIFGNSGGNYMSAQLDYCCSDPLPPTGRGNIAADPGFVRPGSSDYHLAYGSPCIDAGTNLSSVLASDLDANPRPLDGDGNGRAAFDMGAYEFDARTLVPDIWFFAYGLNPADPHVVSGDPDHDGSTTFQEWIADTDPTYARSCFHIAAISNGPPVTVQFLSSRDRLYTLEHATNLTAGSWKRVPGRIDVPGRGGMDALSDLPGPAQQRFYRVGVRVP